MLDDLLSESFSDDFIGHTWVVLRRDKNVINTQGSQLAAFIFVFHNDLGLAIRAEPWDRAILSLDGHLLT